MHFQLTVKYDHEIGEVKERAKISPSNIFLPFILDILIALDIHNEESICQANIDLDFIKSLHEKGEINKLQLDLISLFIDEDIEDHQEAGDLFLFNYHFDAMNSKDMFMDYLDEFDILFDLEGGQSRYVYKGFKLKVDIKRYA